MTRAPSQGIRLALLSAALFGVSTPLAKTVVAGVQPQTFAGLLCLGSGIGLALVWFGRPAPRRAVERDSDGLWGTWQDAGADAGHVVHEGDVMARIGLDGRVSPLQRSLGSQWQDLELEARGLAATRLPSRAPVLFASDGDDLVWHAWKPTPGSPWTPWESLAGFAADIRATVIPNGGPWRDWTPIDDLPGGSRAIEVASLTGGGLVLLARGRDGGLYHRWQDKPFGRWHLWEVLETGIEQFSLTKPASGGLAVFAVARGGCLRHRKQTKPFGVFRIGMDHELSHRWRDSLDGPWTDLDRLGATRARRIALRPGSPGQGKIVIRIT